MSSVLPFFEIAGHQLAKLRAQYPSHPQQAAWRLALWSVGQILFGNMVGDICYVRSSHADNILHLAFLLRGGIGDIILNMAWIEALVSHAESPCSVDIYTNTSKGCMESLCLSSPYVEHIHTLKEKIVLSRYDAVFDIMQNPSMHACCRERLTALSPELEAYVRRLIRFQSSHASYYVDENQAMGIQYAAVMGNFRRGQADFDGSLGLKDSTFVLRAPLSREEISRRFGVEGEYITLQREAGAAAASLKLWSPVKYSKLLEELGEKFPHTPVVLLGVEKNFEVPAASQARIFDLRGRTDFDEFMTLVRYAKLHIGCEGVVPHLRHYLRGGPSLVLFGPSCARMLGYPENEALSGTECPGGCEGILPAWQEVCLKGYSYCHSLEEITVDQVMSRVEALLHDY